MLPLRGGSAKIPHTAVPFNTNAVTFQVFLLEKYIDRIQYNLNVKMIFNFFLQAAISSIRSFVRYPNLVVILKITFEYFNFIFGNLKLLTINFRFVID